MKCAYFAGGCFWCIVPKFVYIEGVNKVISGYSGGSKPNPTYSEVKSQQTGHREAICVIYDEKKVSIETLFNAFINAVDPFDDGGQYIDRGHSYTLAFYYIDEEEKQIAKKIIDELETISHKKVYISLEKFNAFYNAEEEHQDYYKKHPKEFEEELIASGRKKLS